MGDRGNPLSTKNFGGKGVSLNFEGKGGLPQGKPSKGTVIREGTNQAQEGFENPGVN